MKKILVIGAAGGIGLEVTRQLAARGDHVVATVLDAAQAAQVRDAVPAVAQVEILLLDDADRVAARVGEIVAAMGGVDQVAVCAAIGPIGPAELTPVATYAKAMTINFLANVAIFQAAIPALRASRGRLLLISSMSGRVALPFLAAYTASKHALEGWADIVRQEIAADGVELILVEPGGVRTGMVAAQIALARQMESELNAEQAQRYGPFYKGFAAAAQAGYDSTGSRPEQVGQVIADALAADRPETRYIVGEDARQLIGARAAMGDREMDATLAAFFSSAG